MKYKPDVYDSPVAVSAETNDFVQYMADTTALLDELATLEGVSEEDSLRFMTLGLDRLTQSHVVVNELNSTWHREKNAIDPDKDFAGFLSWQGTSEPETMARTRYECDAVGEQGRRLSYAIASHVVETYVRYHTEEIEVGPEDTSAYNALVRQLSTAKKNTEEDTEEYPLSEQYAELFTKAKKNYHFESSIDMRSLLLNSLVKKRMQYTEKGIAAQKEQLNTESDKIQRDLTQIWQEKVTAEGSYDENWNSVYTNLLHEAGLQDQENSPKAQLISDAVHLFCYQQTVRKQLARTPYIYASLEDTLYDSVQREGSLLDRAQRTLKDAEKFEDPGVSIAMLAGLRPRLKDAITYLLANSHQVTAVAVAAKAVDTTDVYMFNRFWERALSGKRLPGDEYRKPEKYTPNKISDPSPSATTGELADKS